MLGAGHDCLEGCLADQYPACEVSMGPVGEHHTLYLLLLVLPFFYIFVLLLMSRAPGLLLLLCSVVAARTVLIVFVFWALFHITPYRYPLSRGFVAITPLQLPLWGGGPRH